VISLKQYAKFVVALGEKVSASPFFSSLF
jgi:hypothetical protein